MLMDLIKNEEGQSIVEYSLLLTLIGASMVFMMTLMGINLAHTIGLTDVTIERYAKWAYEKFSTK